jgi:hypothetical protein
MEKISSRTIASISTLFLFFMLFYCGCETLQTRPDELTVNVMVTVFVDLFDEHGQNIIKNVDGMPMKIEIIKNGNDRFVYERILQQGKCQATGSFTLYKDQYVECSASVTGQYQGFIQTEPVSIYLSWETANDSASMTRVYNWFADLTLNLKKIGAE